MIKIFDTLLLVAMVFLNIGTIGGIIWEFKFSPNPPDLLAIFCIGSTVLAFDIILYLAYRLFKEEE